jgi:hypothetical protein
MPFVEVFTREKLSDEIRTKLAEELSNTIMIVELGGPTSPRTSQCASKSTMDSGQMAGRFLRFFN